MKRIIVILCVFGLLISGCARNVPAPIDLQATVQASVQDAMDSNQYVDQATLLQALDDLEKKITYDTDLKIEAVKTEMAFAWEVEKVETFPTPTLAVGSSTKIESDGNCVDKFAFISDVTFPDGTMTLPKTVFTKSWYIQNTGTCVWNQNYKVVFVSGAAVGMDKKFPLFSSQKMLKPGESTIVSVKIAAPEERKEFTTYWALESPSGKIFGAGDSQNVYLSSRFKVGSQYNFYENLAGAICSDDQGLFFCGSSDRSSGRGTAYYASSPTVESNYAGQQSIVISPPKGGGKTRVAFGPIRFERGTWIRATTSCPPNAPLCDNWVRLYLQAEGQKEQLVIETQENNDGFSFDWNTQLSEGGYHDQSLTFIFEVESIGGVDGDDSIIIQVPRLTDQAPR